MRSIKMTVFQVVVLITCCTTLISGLPTIEDVFHKLWNTEQLEEKHQEHVGRQKRQSQIGDDSPLPYEARSSVLPMIGDLINTRYMPTIGNGLIGATIYDKAVYLNNLYNGAGADSHRAMIPVVNMMRIKFDPEVEQSTQRTYTMNVKQGYFMEEIISPSAEIRHYTYIHHKYIRLLVSHVEARRRGHYGSNVPFEYINIDIRNTTDILFGTPTQHENVNWYAAGKTVTSENGAFTKTVHVYYHDQTQSLSLKNDETAEDTMVMAIDTNDATARGEFDYAAALLASSNGYEGFFSDHVSSWESTWAQGLVEIVGGELVAQKVAWFSQFYILSTLPSIFANEGLPYNEVLTGPTRTGLSKGGAGQDYQGHMFWDTEFYILPAVLMMHPELARRMLLYRSTYRQQAAEHAKELNDKYPNIEGYRYPWESASSGNDVTPDTCIACRETQLHVTASIAWAIRMYFSATQDKTYLTDPDYAGCDVAIDIAKFLQELCIYNPNIARYDITGVMGPDDWHPDVTNNAYTNVVTSLAIHFARYLACQCDRDEVAEVPDKWIEKAMYLELPYDNIDRLHYQYEGFQLPDISETNISKPNNTRIKQADAVLLTFPLNWNASADIFRNDLHTYKTLISDNTPAMTWSFFTVGFKWLEQYDDMKIYYEKSYTDYLIQPFKIWTEYTEYGDQETGSVNFLPGMGGFIQSLIFGFAGVRVRPEFLEFHNPTPPPNAEALLLHDFNYRGANLTIEIYPESVIVICNQASMEHPLKLKMNDTSGREELLVDGGQVVVEDPSHGFYILPVRSPICEHPLDYIFMPWGYNPWFYNKADITPK